MASRNVVVFTSIRIIFSFLSTQFSIEHTTVFFDELALFYQLAEHVEVIKPNKIKQLILDFFILFRRKHNLQ